MAILPYYVANLNIEATYAAIVGKYEEFPGLCFVDTLDNVAALGIYSGHQHDLFATISDENSERVRRQNSRKISIVIGNPPYNAWQENYNQNNANRPYARVDQRIAATYVKEGTAQNKNSVYDMYTRFVRWASDRVKDEGVIAFIVGRKPFAKAAYDGFRKVIAREFAEIWVFDLGGDVRDNPKLSGTKHNVFGIQTGVAMVFLVKKKGHRGGAVIRYAQRPEYEERGDKLAYLSATRGLSSVEFQSIRPDRNNDWLEQSDNDWSALPAIVEKGRSRGLRPASIFHLVSSGIQTKMDDWVTDRDPIRLLEKLSYVEAEYAERLAGTEHPRTIKWHRELERHAKTGRVLKLPDGIVTSACFRPFTRLNLYFDRTLNSQLFRLHDLFRGGAPNPGITFSIGKRAGPGVLGTDRIPSYDMFVPDACQFVARFRFNKEGERLDNITDWALKLFTTRYGKAAELSKDDIFAYVYAVLHDPVYRETYALNLKREFPRIPLYPDFRKWRDWGQALLDLHIGYEAIEPADLTRTDAPDPKRAEGTTPAVKLKSDKENGVIVLDADTQLSGVPIEAWRYRLGNRSAIDWVLDQHKEKTPKDPTIREKFNTYRFAEYKETVVGLLARVVTVSVETVAITDAMAALPASAREQKVDA